MGGRKFWCRQKRKMCGRGDCTPMKCWDAVPWTHTPSMEAISADVRDEWLYQVIVKQQEAKLGKREAWFSRVRARSKAP